MLSSGIFMKCECSIMNDNPVEFDAIHVFPKDMYLDNMITDDNVGTYFNFIKKLENHRDSILHCTCALDESDVERISFIGFGVTDGMISFTMFNNSKHDPQKLFERLIDKYKENKQENF